MKKFLRRFSRLNRDFEGIARPTVQRAFVNRPQWSVFATGLLVQWNLRAEKACTHRSEERLRVWKAFFRSAICGIPLCRSSFARKYGLLRQGVRRSLRELSEFLSETRCNMFCYCCRSAFFGEKQLLQ